MKLRVLGRIFVGVAAMMVLSPAFGQSGLVSSVALQGQNKGTNTWSGGNLMGWQELDFIPCRVLFTGSASSQSVTLTFPHLTGTTPGFENLYNFTTSSNVSFVSGPVLSAPVSGSWSYTFKVNVTNSGSVNFFARLAAGAHLNVGSSLQIGGSPQSMGQLQIHKPQAGPGAPDLAVVKTGPVTVPQGGTIVYTLTYTNKATGTNVGVGVQLSDILPPGLTIDTSTLPSGANYAGNTIFFDVTNLPPHAGGKVTFSADVPWTMPAGTVLTNFAQILCSQNDANTQDNTSTWLTTVTAGCAGVNATPLQNLLRFVGSTAVFSTTASGSGPFSYVWQKDGTNIIGQTGSSLVLTNLAFADNGTYSVIVSGACGSPVTNSATLMVDTCFPAVDVMVVIDRSGSMSGAPYFDALAACSNFVKNLYLTTNADQAGLVSFNSSATLNQTLTNSLSQLDESIAAVPAAGGLTSISLGLQTAQAELTSTRHSPQSLPVMVLMSDGNPTGSDTVSNALYWAAQAKNSGTLIFTVGLGTVNASLLQGIASTTNDYSFTTNSAQLTALFNAVSTEICRPPTNIFVMGPSNVTVCAGNTANFGVTVTGCDSYRYEWFKDGTLLGGQTNSTLTLADVAVTNSGIYSVAVLSDCQNVTNSATLTVNASTTVSMPPSDQTVCPGQMAQFSVGATGTDLMYQWYYGSSPLTGQTSNVLTLNAVTATNAGTYSVVISGTCSSVTNSAMLTVNASTLVMTPPSDQTVCPGQVAQFGVGATGSDLTYQWYFGSSLMPGQTSNVLTLSGVTAGNAGTYSVVIIGACGTAVTNSAILAVNQNVSVAPLPNVTNLIGGNAVFTAVVSGTGPFAYQWYQGANPLPGQTNSTLMLNNLQPASGGSYSVSVTGQCGNAATAGFILTIDLPPVVSITYPTNGQVFIDPATFNVLASASDPDGTVTNVQFFSSTNGTNFTFLGQTNNTPYLTIASNLPPGNYTFIATATDNLGASAQSAPVTVQVVPTEPPDVTVIGNVTLHLQDGYQWLSNVVCNPVYSRAEAVRIYVHNITNSTIRVVNASGTNNGLPYVESPAAIEPGTCWTNVIMFYDPYGVQFYPTLTVELVSPPNAAGNPAGVVVPMFPARMLHDGTFLIEFSSTNSATYYVQYSGDMVNWNTAFPAITGTGQHMQWIDCGPPATTSLPAANVRRFYRVIQAQ